MKKESLFSIRQVIDLTGVSEFTIRGWENRYQAILPSRTESGRRLYSKEDLLKIKALKDLVDRGHQISSIANSSYSELQEFLTETISPIEDDTKSSQVTSLLSLAEKFSWDKVKKIFRDQKNKQSGKDFIFNFILPLIKEINLLVSLNQFSISNEHILSAMIKEELYSLKNASPTKRSKARLVFAAPENELHEIGILLSSTLANISGKNSLYIGVNTPKQQIADVCIRYEATHLILSSTNGSDDGQKKFLMVIHFLDKQLPKNIMFCLGGPVLINLAVKLKRDLKIFKTIEEINLFFENLKG